MNVNIEKYAPYFHDGDVREIEYVKDEIVLVMESAALLPEWNEDNIALSKNATISGKLHISGVKKNKEDNMVLSSFKIKELYSEGNIHHFEATENNILLQIWWIKYPYEESTTFEYEIEAEKIYWENIPTLSDEYWASLENS